MSAIGVVSETPDHGGSVTESTNVGGDFSFSSLRDKAMDAFNSGTPEPSAVVEQAQVQEVQAPSTEASAEVTNVENASQAQLAQLTPESLVEVEVDGQKVTMPWSEARGGVMRQAKFTKEMQSLARQREEFNTERQSLAQRSQERDALVSLLSDERLMRQFLEKKYPNLIQQARQDAVEQVASTAADPDDIATVSQVEQVAKTYASNVEQLVNNLKQELQREVATVTQTIEDRQAIAKLSGEINSTITELFKTHPQIQRINPDAEQLLRWNVAQMNPQTPEETIEAFKTVFGGWVENLNAVIAEQNKTAVVNKQKLVQNNIQPPGGSQVQPVPTNYKTPDGKVDWKALRQAAENMLGQKG